MDEVEDSRQRVDFDDFMKRITQLMPGLPWYKKGSGVTAAAFFASFILGMFLVLLGIVPQTWISEGIVGIFFIIGFLSAMAASK